MRDNLIEESRLELEITVRTPLELDIKTINLNQLKSLMRSTSLALNHPIRDRIWFECALRYNKQDNQFDPKLDISTNKLPLFVDPRIARFFSLNSCGQKEIQSVLWHICQSCPHVTFAPLAYPLTALFLHFHSAEDTYKAIYSLINSKDLHFIGTTRSDKCRDAIILVKLTNKFGILRSRKFGADVREKLRNNALDTAFAEYLEWIFCLPFHYCVRIMDCFLIEGEKFLFRVALSLALLYEKHKKQNLNLEKMRAFCESIQTVVSPQQLIVCALKITRLSRKDIARAKTKAEQRSERVNTNESPIHSSRDLISAKDYVLGTRIAPRRFKSSVVENWCQLDTLWEWLPDRVVVREPQIVFTTRDNGHSLQTFFTLTNDFEPTILLIKTIENNILGAFCSSCWSTQTRSGQYFGTGETFLFSLHPKPIKYEWVGRNAQHITHSQQLFQSASSRSLTIGSGGGRFGLFIDESLVRGQTDKCETFANEPLTPDSTHFDVAILEVIAFC